MAADSAPGGWHWVARRTPTEKLILGFVAAGVLAGLAFIGNGFYMKAKAELSQLLLKRSFERVAEGGVAKPWPWADFTAEARIAVPRLGESDIVLSGASGEALAFGPARLAQTPLPGASGTSVIAAHRDTHFQWLADVRPDDLISVTNANGVTHSFQVRGARVARWDASGIDPDRQGHWLALTTCWPFDAMERGPLRYIVEAEMVEPQTATAQASAEPADEAQTLRPPSI